MTKKQKTILLRIMVIFILIITFFLPSIRSFLYRSMNKGFAEKTKKYALSANIKIVQLQYRKEGNVSSSSVSAGASGVIIRKESDKYYALTAEHVIKELENIDKTQFIVIGYDQLDYRDYLSTGGTYEGVESYYKQLPEAIVEYANEKYDLAIISFSANEDYTVLPISAEMPKYGDLVASVSNPYRKRNVVSVGRVRTRKPESFGDKAGNLQYPIIKHTAMISGGSSGSALLNENLEVVGINLGGGENIFRRFISGMAMPSDRIRAFLDEWESSES